MAAPRRILVAAFRSLAAITALIAAVHAIVQGTGALTFWTPCFVEGYDSDPCQYLQYEAPAPAWSALFALWPAEVVLAVAVLVLALIVHARVPLAATALICVLMSHQIVDYMVSPAVNGGYVSADNAPGFGLPSAVLLAIAAAMLILVAVLPARRSIRESPLAHPAAA